MSYLLDALRKAERERNLGRVPDLERAADELDGPQGSRLAAWVLPVIGVLVAFNLLLMAAAWWWWRGNASPGPQASPPASVASVPETAPARNPVQAPAPDPAPAEPSSARSQASPRQSGPAQRRPDPPSARSTDMRAGASASTQAPAADSDAQARADVGFAQTPGNDNASATDAPVPRLAALPSGQRARLPTLRINGHLYSSIPGRSFVLINGRRYHQGQRLPQGPAVVLIDEQGAVFVYQDVQFRLDAPR